MVEVVNYPVNKDDRGWFAKYVIREPFEHCYLCDTQEVFGSVDLMNRLWGPIWGCKIRRVVINGPQADD